jgi:hypothetical protein
MSYLRTLLVRRHEDEVRYIGARMWLKALCFSATVAFFVGLGYGKQSTAAGYDGLIAKLPQSCQQDLKTIVWHGFDR